MTPKEIFSPFAKVALVAVKEIKEIERKLKRETDKRNAAILKKQRSALKHIIDRCFRLTADFLPVSVSKVAQEYCRKEELGDIFGIRWGDC